MFEFLNLSIILLILDLDSENLSERERIVIGLLLSANSLKTLLAKSSLILALSPFKPKSSNKTCNLSSSIFIAEGSDILILKFLSVDSLGFPFFSQIL